MCGSSPINRLQSLVPPLSKADHTHETKGQRDIKVWFDTVHVYGTLRTIFGNRNCPVLTRTADLQLYGF